MESIVYTETQHFLALGLLCKVVSSLSDDGYRNIDFWEIAKEAGHNAVAYQECDCSKIEDLAKSLPQG